ncbi:MAG: DNA polymerase I [Proteobacteria bacterium]|nr:DNA polymerase I [Pseudomonadota bacterium]
MNQSQQAGSERPRLFIFDGMALLFRSFYAMGRAGLTSPEGMPTGAIFGFIKILQKIVKEQNPTHVAVTWDRKEKTFRHEAFTAYKANRSETPPDLLTQIPVIKDLLERSGIPTFSLAGYEGDDVIGTIALNFSQTGDVFIVSADKDFMQLVGDHIKLFSLKAGDEYEVMGRDHVIDYFGVPPEQVCEVLAITGDKVDNIPGVKGIGDKGAAKLIQEFGTVKNIYDNLEKVANPRLRGMLETSRENALLSRQLVEIHTAVPLNVDESLMRYSWEELSANQQLRQEIQSLGMQSLLKGFSASAASASRSKGQKAPAGKQDSEGLLFSDAAGEAKPADVQSIAAEWGKRDYTCILTKAELSGLCEKIVSPDLDCFAFDTETTGLDFIEHKPIGCSFCFAEGAAFYVPLTDVHLEGGPLAGSLPRAEFSARTAVGLISDALHRRKATLVAHNLKFDLHQMHNIGVSLGDAPIADTMIAAWMLNPSGGGYGLDAQSMKVLGLAKIPTSALIGKEAGRQTMLQVPLEQLSEYACEDVDATLRLWSVLRTKLSAQEKLSALFQNLEMPLLRLLAQMERTGVHIDADYLADLANDVQNKITEIERQIYGLCGQEFNIGSPKQLGHILFEVLKVHESVGFKGKLAKTTLGFKTDANVLEQFQAHPVVALVQEFRELSKLLNTYIMVLPQLVKSSTGRIHTSFHQIGTATGRLSSSDPNLQNIPVRTELGKKVRQAFCASDPSNVILSIDYSQVELRVMAHLAQDETMIAAFKSGADIHRQTAARILGKQPEQVTPEERGNAKTINFGIIYGMGAQRLSREQKIPLAEAKSFIERYFLNFAGVYRYLETQRQKARDTGVVHTHFGRPRPVDLSRAVNPAEVKALENIAINSPIQGTAADIMKFGMLRVAAALTQSGLHAQMLLQVHDELVLECPREEVDATAALLKNALEGAVEFSIPLIAEVGFGRTWLEAK